jgi:hypothetical protein
MVISADAQITVTDTSGTMLVQASLTPVADAAYLYGSNELQDPVFRPCYFPCDHGDVTAGCVGKFHGSRDLILFLPRNSCFLSRWNSDELVSQGGGFPLELLDL